jgi:methanethiol S-methyltransferase
MWRSMAKVMAATAVYGIFHSAVASLAAKGAAARTFGPRNRSGLYRVSYILQSFVTFAFLGAYAWRQPNRDLYRIRGPLALLMHAGQVTAILYATWAASQVGLRRITGLESFAAWLGNGHVPQEPEAQGPALDVEGRRNAIGPFAWSRHPLNFAPLPIFWLWPRMTANLLGYNTAMTVYLVLGSIHEEARLRRAFGADYEAYQRSGVPFYVPIPARNPLQSTAKSLTLPDQPE